MDMFDADAVVHDGIAIIGMSGRFPGAGDVATFWRNQLAGLESIQRFSAADLEVAGAAEAAATPGYVAARSILPDIDLFDAAFFGMYPREAALMDPQHRLFMECCWEAFENAGYDPATSASTGVYAGCSIPTYLLNHLCRQPGFLDRFTAEYQVGSFPELVGNGQDFLASKISYKLNLQGPSISLLTACSTSLVAVVQACQSLLTYQCNMALAGGASISLPQRRGTTHVEGGMTSPDGHCRTFDADAGGTVFGSGVGVVLLKRLDDAIKDGDSVVAVIRGFGINNDGSVKVGYTAPSIEGQARAIATAHEFAGVPADTIGYIEAHGTGTPLGDPIELAALTQVFRTTTDRKNFCTIGTAKTNVGHLDVAAGVTGLINASQIVKHGIFPPTLHFKKPNPKFDLANSPFRVVTEQSPWSTAGTPRRAGVSAFGVGGTNAHVVIEQAPQMRVAPTSNKTQLLTLSARSAPALERMCRTLAEHLRAAPDTALADAAWTLQNGRRRFEHARTLTARTAAEAIDALSGNDPARCQSGGKVSDAPAVHFLFPGQGAQYPGMGRDLYLSEPRFREAFDQCAELLKPLLKADLRDLVYPKDGTPDAAARALKNTAVAQPAIFAMEYALARLWMAWGIAPRSMVGHSVGEFAAACIAGVFSLEDALSMVAERGRLMQDLPAGGMLSVRLSADAARQRLSGGLSIAAVNAPGITVIAGPLADIAVLEGALKADGIVCRALVTSHAFHSSMMDGVIAPFRALVASKRLSAPKIPLISCVTGQLLTDGEATDPDYWARHLRQPVRYADAIAGLRKDVTAVLLEVGPGNTLGTLARLSPGAKGNQVIVSSLGGPDASEPDTEALLQALGSLWIAGVQPDWSAVHGTEAADRRRIPLPTYPFERKRHWIDAVPIADQHVARQSATASPPTGLAAPFFEAPVLDAPAMLTKSLTPPQAAPTSNGAGRVARIRAAAVDLFEELSGMQLGTADTATFLEIGFDSLFLTQATRALQTKLNLKITFRQLLGDVSSFDALAAYAAAQLPGTSFADAMESVPQPIPVAPPAAISVAAPAVVSLASVATVEMGAPMERLMREQLQAMSQLFNRQIDVLQGTAPANAALAPVAALTAATGAAPTALATTVAVTPATPAIEIAEPKAHGPYKPLQARMAADVTDRQKAAIASIVARMVKHASKSKALTQAHRHVLADPRVVSGFRETWKEMVFPIVTNRSKGSRLWDLDGNEYVDLLNGFGPIMFGHRPDFIEQALDTQLREGIEIGPQTPLAGEIAEQFCAMTGNERMTFCNTGSEAVMAAMRVARAVTGRDKVVMFSGDYHGMFDEVLVKPAKTKAGAPYALPLAPGIPRESSHHIVVLDYGTDHALAWIRANADALAAVIVEPVQSRRPDFQPIAFLKEVRAITEKSGTAFVFDEVVTGFRTHPGGCQALFGIRADMATYGKVIGGGMPVGILAGKAQFLDALDGGAWQYGDASVPEVGVTFFAGTFVRHPLTLAAVKAVIARLSSEGPALQQRLGDKTSALVARINAVLAKHGTPAKLKNFYSFLYFSFPSDERFASLFYYLLRLNGVHILEGFPCFLTTEHSDADLDTIVRAFEAAATEMRDAGLFARPDTPAQSAAVLPMVATARPRLTESQREIVLAAMMGDDASCAFNESISVHLQGPLNAAALSSALNAVIARHDALRLSLDTDLEHATFATNLSIDLPLVDVSHFDAKSSEQALANVLADVLAADANLPFDLTKGPLVRAKLLRLAMDRHVLVFSAHHVVCDGWSMNIIINELAALYSAHADKRTAALEPVLPFAGFAAANAGDQASPEREETIRYWLEKFKDKPQPLDLPLDRPRGPSRTYAGTTLRRHIGKEHATAIKHLGRTHGASLFATLLAGFGVLISKVSGETDIVVGVPMAGQSQVEGGSLVGHCVNFLPLRVKVDGDKAFTTLLADVKTEVLDAYDHQKFTYGTLVRRLDPKRDPRRLPLTELQFNVEQIGAGAAFSGLQMRVEANAKAAVNSDLFVNVIEGKDGLDIDCDFNTDLFDEATISGWLDAYASALVAAAQTPGQPIAALPGPAALHAEIPAQAALSEAERVRMETWNRTATAFPRDASIIDLFHAQVAMRPHAPAVVTDDSVLTYDQLNRRANQIARHMRKLGVGADEIVACCLPRSPDLVVAVLAILKAGCAYVPFEPTFPRDRIEFMLSDTRARVLLTTTAVGLAPSNTVAVLLDQADSPIWSLADTNLDVAMGPQSLAYVMYTSGSTGRPKGVMVEHRAVVRLVRDTNYCPFGPDQVFLHNAPMSFDASTFEIWGALLNGAKVAVMPAGEPSLTELGRVIRTQGVTALFLTSGLFHLMVEQRLEDLRGLRLLLAGGEVMSAQHMQKAVDGLPGCLVANIYGPTEATTFSTFEPLLRGNRVPLSVPIGQPLANARLYILNEGCAQVALGEVGELFIAGDGLARGYLNNPELTAQKFVTVDIPGSGSERLYRTGDLARFLDNGSVEFHGRIDGQVKLRGFRIELGEIEVTLAATRRCAAGVCGSRAGSRPRHAIDCVLFTGERAADQRLRARPARGNATATLHGAVDVRRGRRLSADRKRQDRQGEAAGGGNCQAQRKRLCRTGDATREGFGRHRHGGVEGGARRHDRESVRARSRFAEDLPDYVAGARGRHHRQSALHHAITHHPRRACTGASGPFGNGADRCSNQGRGTAAAQTGCCKRN